MRDINRGGPQGALWGILEYLAQSNNNTDFISREKKFKFIDDLSMLEMINLLSIGLSSCNWKVNVASDIPTDGYIIPAENLKTQQYMNKISEWTSKNKMMLNTKKTCAIIFNFTRNSKFTSRIKVQNDFMEIIHETKLLGVIINDKLTWGSNTTYLVTRANARMGLLHKLVDFGVPTLDLVNIYVLYVRSILEQSCQVWSSSLTLENFHDLERVQKNAMKIILQEDYENYSSALNITGLDTLFQRRDDLCLKFAKSCTTNQKTAHMFPKNPVSYEMNTRFRKKYLQTHAKTERLKTSAIPYMQGLLNK